MTTEEPPDKRRKENSLHPSTTSVVEQSDVEQIIQTLRGLTDLSPPDFSYILNKLSFEDKLRVRLTCKYFYKLVIQDRGFNAQGVLKMDFKKGFNYEVFRILSLQIKVKLPSQNELAKKENLATEVLNFFNEFQDKIVDIELSNPCRNLITQILPQLTNLRKIRLQDRFSNLNSVEIATLIENNSSTLENLSLICIRPQKFSLTHSYPNMKVFSIQECNSQVARQFVSKLTKLNKITVNDNDDISDHTLSALIDNNSPSLVSLDLKAITANSTNIILKKPLHKIKELTLERCGSNMINQIVPKVCKLRKLCVFDENYHISTEKLNNLIKQNAPTLQYLELSADNKLEEMQKISFPKMEVLKLIGSKSCSDAAFKYVIENSASTLTTLSCRDIRDEIQVEKRLANLKELEIRKCADQFAESIIRYAKPSLRNLEQLRLCNYKGDNLRDYVYDMACLPFMKVLRLNNCERPLVRSLLEKCASSLTELSLTDISDGRFDLTTQLSKLKKLYLFQCDDDVTRLVLEKSAASLTEMKLYSSNLNISIEAPFPNLTEVTVNNRGRVDVRDSDFISQGGNLKQLEKLAPYNSYL